MSEYFRCEPGILCNAADYCTGMETKPSLGLGDYIRISDQTGESLPDIWIKKGDAGLSELDRNNRSFLFTLGLIHDPCPYLNSSFKCSIYESRPYGCSAFPTDVLLNKQESNQHYGILRCLQGKTPEPNDLKFLKQVNGIVHKEIKYEMERFWKGKHPVLTFPTIGDYFTLATTALDLVEMKDPEAETARTKRLLLAVNTMQGIVSNNFTGFQILDFIHNLQPVAYEIFQEEIADKLNSVDRETFELFRETSREYKELLVKLRKASS
jgi:Fe-S-cluster containining protein